MHVLYQGGCHYDALVPDSAEVAAAFARCNGNRSPAHGKQQQGGQHGQPQRQGQSPQQGKGQPHKGQLAGAIFKRGGGPSTNRASPWKGGGKGGKGKGGWRR